MLKIDLEFSTDWIVNSVAFFVLLLLMKFTHVVLVSFVDCLFITTVFVLLNLPYHLSLKIYSYLRDLYRKYRND